MVNEKKVAIVGCGFVGSSSAFALMQSGLFSEMVLIDVDKNRAEGEALDIAHGMTFAEPMKIYAGDYSDVADAAMIVVTAGAAQKPGGGGVPAAGKVRFQLTGQVMRPPETREGVSLVVRGLQPPPFA